MRASRIGRNVSLLAAAALSVTIGVDVRTQEPQADLRAVAARLPQITFPSSMMRSKAAFEQRSPKVSVRLLALADDVRTKGIGGLAAKAMEVGVVAEDDLVSVSLSARSEDDVPALEEAVRQAGGEVQEIVANVVLAKVPPNRIEGLGRREELHFASPQAYMTPALLAQATDTGTATPGVLASRVEQLHKSGVLGTGVKVGILDFGFKGLRNLVSRKRLPQPKAVKAFGSSGVENNVEHGTACAEIVHQMAPGADLYLASAGSGDGRATNAELIAGARWLASQGVRVISFSGGGHVTPHNGRGEFDQVVNEIVSKQDVVWVNAAGNEGETHWSGEVFDDDHDQIVEIGPNERRALVLRSASGMIRVIANWDDWGANPLIPTSSQDLDMFLFTYDPNKEEFGETWASTEPQNGRQPPIEVIAIKAPNPKQLYVVAFQATHLTRRVRLHVYCNAGVSMNPETARGSISSPATAESALGVGAVNVKSGQLEPFSSQGPTDDDRLKPDVVAPDGVMCDSYGKQSFEGTSAACPHVAGFAALIRELRRSDSAAEVRKKVVQAVRDMGPPGPDPQFGNGHIDGTKLEGGGGGTGVEPRELSLPDELGGPLSTTNMERLFRLAERAEARDDFKIVTGKPTYAIGDGMKVGLLTGQPCYYALVHRSADGKYTVLAPSGSGSAARLDAGKHALPPAEETWKISEPTGRESVLLVGAAESIDLAQWLKDPGGDGVRLAIASYSVVK